MKSVVFSFFIAITFFSCKKTTKENVKTNQLEFAKHLNYQENDRLLTVTSENQSVEYNVSKLPYKKIVLTQTAIIGYLAELEALDLIIGVTDSKYIYNDKIHQNLKNGLIHEMGNDSELFVEKILTEKPDLLITSSNPNYAKYIEIIKASGIDVLTIDDYKETTPIGRAEYLKLIGKLIGKEELAIKKFDEIKSEYLATKALIAKAPEKKNKTIVNTMYGDVWYLPGKNTLQTQFLNDAHANYVFANDSTMTSLSKNLEEVYSLAKDANYWLNASDFRTLSQMKASHHQYEWFSAFKDKNVYNTNLKSNENGANDYFEKGVARPDLILKDLGKIFYPELFQKHSFYFYQKLK